MIDFKECICHSYFYAKHYIIKNGFCDEIDWQEQVSYKDLTEQVFLKEISWVILASGLSDKFVRKVYPSINTIMFNLQKTSQRIENFAIIKL